MNNKNKYIYIVLGVACLFMIGLIFINSRSDFGRLLKASISEKSTDNSVVIEAARQMAKDNIDSLEEENVYTIKDLINGKYLDSNQVDPVTLQEYDEDTRIIVQVKDGVIEDVYISNVLFRHKFSCENVCYLDFDNYIYFNNETYRILKIDQQGYLYITNNYIKKTSRDNIDSYLKNLNNSYSDSKVYNVISLSNIDIEKSNIIELSDSTIVNTNSGYKLYSVYTNSLQELDNKKHDIIPIIVLKNDLTYEKGNGTKFNPYIVGE